MKIISLVSYPFLPAKSGGQKGIALFYKYFSRYHEITIITTKANSPALAEGYELLNILSNSATRYINPLTFFKIKRLIKEKQITHLVLEHPYLGWLGIMLKHFCGVKLIVHSHNIEGNRWKSLGKWWWKILWNYERQVHRYADYNFFIQDEDRNYAIQAFALAPSKCMTVHFGTEIPGPPSSDAHAVAGTRIRNLLDIPVSTPILLFNGAFSYLPNRDALNNILLRINPVLSSKDFPYVILIMGLDIPLSVQTASHRNIRVLGFVEDLNLYLTGADIFLNPVRSGGGIKTKLVEALSYNLTSVSTRNGAIGIDPQICGGKLIVSADHNWSLYAESIIRAMAVKTSISPEFYNQFYWANITRRAAAFISS